SWQVEPLERRPERGAHGAGDGAIVAQWSWEGKAVPAGCSSGRRAVLFGDEPTQQLLVDLADAGLGHRLDEVDVLGQRQLPLGELAGEQVDDVLGGDGVF